MKASGRVIVLADVNSIYTYKENKYLYTTTISILGTNRRDY